MEVTPAGHSRAARGDDPTSFLICGLRAAQSAPVAAVCCRLVTLITKDVVRHESETADGCCALLCGEHCSAFCQDACSFFFNDLFSSLKLGCETLGCRVSDALFFVTEVFRVKFILNDQPLVRKSNAATREGLNDQTVNAEDHWTCCLLRKKPSLWICMKSCGQVTKS